MKDVERKLISELLKNSRRSDRELAGVIGVSQPTISRMIDRLTKNGVIREYTVVPDFNKLGYHICALTFTDFETPSDVDAMRKLIEEYGNKLSQIPEAMMIERGLGEGANGIVISFHETYSHYLEFLRWMKQFSPQSKYEPHSFLIDLDDRMHIRYLTFSTLAKHLLTIREENKE